MGGLAQSFSRHPLLTTLTWCVTRSWEQETTSRRPPTNQTPSASSKTRFCGSRASSSGTVTRAKCTHIRSQSRFFGFVFVFKKPGLSWGHCSVNVALWNIISCKWKGLQSLERQHASIMAFNHHVCGGDECDESNFFKGGKKELLCRRGKKDFHFIWLIM